MSLINLKNKTKAKQRSLEDTVPLKDMENLMIDCKGNITSVSKILGCGLTTLYDYMDKYPHLKEIRKKATIRLADANLDSAYHKLDKILEKVDEDTSNSFKAVNLILTNHKDSIYYRAQKDTSEESSPAALAHQARLIAERDERIKELEAQLARW